MLALPNRLFLPCPFLPRAAFLSALALGSLPQIGAARAQPVAPFVPTISTSGTASVDVLPDVTTITLGVETERPNAADAARENAKAAQAIVSEIKALGIEARDIKTLSVTIAPAYDEISDSTGHATKRTLRGYIAHNSFSVRIKDIQKAGALASQLIERGANNFYDITFDYSQKEPKMDALRMDAVRDAQRKANSYVTGLGLRLGRVLEIATEPRDAAGPVMRAGTLASPETEPATAIPIEPGVQHLRADVRVTWELAQ
jgi:uncharacterized protein YggE